MTFEYKLLQVHPSVFVVEVDNPYDLSMLFLRAQEFYESSNPEFCGREFTILQYMEWYAKVYSTEQTFSYGAGFTGYNVPSEAITECYAKSRERTPYDKLLLHIDYVIRSTGLKDYHDDYYLVGVVGEEDDNAFDHELAHALFYLDETYRRTMTELVNLLPFKQELFDFLEDEFGYGKHVHVDEAQAYMATGFSDDFEERIAEYEPFRAAFKKVFDEWSMEIAPPITLLEQTVDLFETKHI